MLRWHQSHLPGRSLSNRLVMVPKPCQTKLASSTCLVANFCDPGFGVLAPVQLICTEVRNPRFHLSSSFSAPLWEREWGQLSWDTSREANRTAWSWASMPQKALKVMALLAGSSWCLNQTITKIVEKSHKKYFYVFPLLDLEDKVPFGTVAIFK